MNFVATGVLNKACRICLFLVFMLIARAQGQVTFTIDQLNISSPSFSIDNTSVVYTAPFVGLFPSISIASSAATLTNNGSTIPAGTFKVQATGINGSLLNVLGTTPVVSLASTPQNIYGSLASALPSGTLSIRYILTNSNLAWRAGTYTTNLQFATSVGRLNPTSVPLNVNVTAYLTATPPVPAIQLEVNSLNCFRSTGVSGSFDLATASTVPLKIAIKSNLSKLSYTDGYSGAADPGAAVGLVSARLMMPVVGTPVFLSTTAQSLTPPDGLAIAAGNKQTATQTLSVSAADLKASFLQKGTYATVLSVDVADAQTTPSAATQTLSLPLKIVVKDMSELKVNQASVNLKYNSAQDYINGIYTDIPAYITVSKTTPFDIYVKAGSSTLAYGNNTIPANTITLSPTPDAKGSFNTITLSSTAQKLAAGAMPAIDRQLNVRFSISAENTKRLLGKAAGTYATTITYSLVAL